MYSFYSISSQTPAGLSPQQIETRLASLIEAALKRRSTATAGVITQHIRALLEHPEYRSTWEELCAYRQLLRRWKSLAWLDEGQAYPAAQTSTSTPETCD